MEFARHTFVDLDREIEASHPRRVGGWDVSCPQCIVLSCISALQPPCPSKPLARASCLFPQISRRQVVSLAVTTPAAKRKAPLHLSVRSLLCTPGHRARARENPSRQEAETPGIAVLLLLLLASPPPRPPITRHPPPLRKNLWRRSSSCRRPRWRRPRRMGGTAMR